MFDTFISYQRQDSRADAGRLYDLLSAHFGDEHVFMDIDDIEPGQDFVQVLENSLDTCGVAAQINVPVLAPVILDALAAFPEARRSVSDRLLRLEQPSS
jgi:hypothetical protein